MDKENQKNNQSDLTYYDELNHNTKDRNEDFEKEDDTNILSLLEIPVSYKYF